MPTPARARGRKVSAVQALALLLSFCLVAGIGGVLAAGLALPGVAVANGLTGMSVTAFDDLPSELEQKPLPEKSEILAADGTLLATFYDQNRIVVPLSEIAPIMRKAVIAVEDRRFYEHSGVDPASMLRAAVASAGGETQGASTLTQQYVKNVFLDAAERVEDKNERARLRAAAKNNKGPEGIARKLREAKIAITLEKTMSKDEILEKYLNIAAFGASVYGVESASQYFFSKSAKDLNYIEAATIAGITQSPSAWDPVGPANETPEQDAKRYADSQKRRDKVLRDMEQEHYITAEELAAGLATPVEATLHVSPLRQGCMSAGEVVPGSGFFCDYVTKVIANDPAFGATAQERKNQLYKGGLRITTTLVPGEQAVADAEVKNGVPVDDPSGIASSIVTVEPGTGKITAMAQNRNYSALAEQQPGETSVNYNTSYQYGGSGGFSPGSTFKVFTLLEWLKKGHALQETVNGTRLQYNMSEFSAGCIGRLTGPPYKFGNSEGGRAIPQTVLDATRNSVNSAYMAMAAQLDLCDIMNGAAALGVTKAGNPATNDPAINTPAGDVPFDPLPGNVLGSQSTSPLRMAAAYATFASNGTYCKPIAITSVVDASGAELPVPTADCQAGAVEPKYASAINYTLSNVWSGTAKSVEKPPFPSAGKTGTTSDNEYNWFLGYTPLRATAVWVGYSGEFTSMNGATINGKTYYRGPYGSSIAAPTWSRYMSQILAGVDNPDFAAPANREIEGERVGVPSVLGQSEQQARASLERAGFRVSVSGEQVPSAYPPGTVAEQSASSATRGGTITIKLSSGQPPAGPGGGQPGPGGGPGGGQGGGEGRPGPGGRP
ncbi:penicillin-binding protein [Cellulomonas wangsupingiae]|uniref:Penicillin-binding protein n=1 Tax=Cellulomonas wangsupingiae TaxID=2968085 RepID=A0ABY5K3R2_9CELL|nr:penicillin-binding protein [Cellulomonas wangsupingiae]MCC2336425.1 penicillin-binding protein [Cellulomonas wangsupingiae]MCM0640885.1 penicillin-binding protein [Cellulomonas wangsupingiae]UUI64693.1 penicillin-binding protein [Cellulomonas wangsupingiae]